MIRISKYTKLGILMVITISILIWGLSYLKGHDFFKNTNYYFVRYQRIDGLTESSPVTMNGYKIGQVNNIDIAADKSGDLIITFNIDGDFRIPRNSVARIFSSDIMGTKSVKLIISDSKEFYSPRDTIPGAIEGDLKEQVSMQVLPLKVKAEELLATLDSAITVLTVIFNEEARKNLSESLKNINSTISNIEKTSANLQELVSVEKENIKSIIENMNAVSATFRDRTGTIDTILNNLSVVSDSLSGLSLTPLIGSVTEAAGQLREIVQKFNSDQSTAGLLLNNDDVYKQINELLGSFELLARDIKNNPKRYLHFSALDLGKDVYINTTGQPSKSSGIIYKVHLISTPVKIHLESKLFDGLGVIEEYEASGAFTYMAGQSQNYNDVTELHKKALKSFPDATIVAFKNGKLIKLDKALKNTQ